MKLITSAFQKPLLTLLLTTSGGIGSASAVLVTLTSPDSSWSLSSDEFGAFGETTSGSFAQRDFGTGLTGYAWASAVLITDGVTSQWLASDTTLGVSGLAVIDPSNVVSDLTTGNVRTSVFNVPGFANIQVTLTQAATNSGISQQYSIANSGASSTNLRVISYHDVDLDGGTFANNVIDVSGTTLSVSEGGRSVGFNPSPTGYVGYLAGHIASGVTGNLDLLAVTNSGIPAANLDQFVGLGSGGSIVSDFDTDLNKISDTPADVGYVFQNNVTIDAGRSVDLVFGQSSAIPEPSSLAMLGLLGFTTLLRRRR